MQLGSAFVNEILICNQIPSAQTDVFFEDQYTPPLQITSYSYLVLLGDPKIEPLSS